jgi:hypothetical protein
MPEIRDYHSTLAASTLNILFLKILKISRNTFFHEEQIYFFVKESKVKHLLKYFIFKLESSKLINYSKDVH